MENSPQPELQQCFPQSQALMRSKDMPIITWGFETIMFGGLRLIFLQFWSDEKCPCVDSHLRISCVPVRLMTIAFDAIFKAKMRLGRGHKFFPLALMLFSRIIISSGHEEMAEALAMFPSSAVAHFSALAVN
ncbi:hypothetical protein WISP_149500 [Willisornis vidua]|uniref:Uncharacterized protein n=1 Tax=Willisornis vidua TaxID=1566151 RepID=A0ABQ9CK49_9PASS|nr:hypothetical protein WISP_149500 [Willisornis vidua]